MEIVNTETGAEYDLESVRGGYVVYKDGGSVGFRDADLVERFFKSGVWKLKNGLPFEFTFDTDAYSDYRAKVVNGQFRITWDDGSYSFITPVEDMLRDVEQGVYRIKEVKKGLQDTFHFQTNGDSCVDEIVYKAVRTADSYHVTWEGWGKLGEEGTNYSVKRVEEYVKEGAWIIVPAPEKADNKVAIRKKQLEADIAEARNQLEVLEAEYSSLQ